MSRTRRVQFLSASLLPLALAGAAGCVSSGPDENTDDLQAILHDEDLTNVARGALSAPTTGTGGAVATGMGTGTAGASGTTDGGVSTGTGGFIGTTGAGGSFGTGMGTGVAGSSGTDGGFAGAGGFIGTTGAGGFVGTGMGGFIGTGGVVGTTGAGGRPVPDGGVGGGGGFIPDGGPGGGGGFPNFFSPVGRWTFDDCNDFRTDLFDSSFNNHTAFRSVDVTCVAGVSGQAVALEDKKEDIVYVPDQPDFTFEQGLTVAGFFKPTALKGVQTLFRKRDQGTSSFALVLNGKSYQLVINLGTKAASVSGPAKVGQTTHVAGTYDGTTLRLYLDGVEVANTRVRGTIENGAGPLLMGNDGSQRLFTGFIDSAVFGRTAASAGDIAALTCVPANPTVVGTPAVSAPTPAGTPVLYDIAITNHNSRTCAAEDYFFSTGFVEGLFVQPQFQIVSQVPSGGTSHLTMSVTGSDDAEPGTITVPFQAFAQSRMGDGQFRSGSGSVDFVLTASGCRVSTPRELMVRNLSVVDDPVRTNAGPSMIPGDPRAGAWTFKRLVENMAPTAADAPAMVEAMLRSFTVTTTVNGFDIDSRPGMSPLVLDPWPRTSTGALDLTRAPVNLLAIVNRFDLRNLANGDAGEGRLVFGVLGPGGFPLQFTIIFEYKLPATTPDDVRAWANAWHALGALPFPSEQYNVALQAITDRFTGRGVRPGHPNGNAINAVRTNEIDLQGGIWQLREFVLSPTTGRLVPATVKLTPDNRFNFSRTLADFINQNEASILTETHDVPESFQGSPFLGGAVFNDLSSWIVPGVNNNEARHKFALNTCNGCHSTAETGVGFLQISPRFPGGGEAGLSGFLTGTVVFDPVTGQQRTFNDLGRRSADFKFVVCPGTPPPPPPPGPGPIPPRGDGGVGGSGGSTGAGGTSGGTGGAGGRGGIPTPLPGMPGAASSLQPLAPTLTKGINRVH